MSAHMVTIREALALGMLLVAGVLLVGAWCWPGMLKGAPRPKWRGWWWDGEE